VSESKKNLDPSDPAYYAPPRSRDRSNASSEKDRQALSVSRGLDEQLAHVRTTKSSNSLPSTQSDVFADAVARMLREHGTGLAEAPSVLKKRSSIPAAAGFVVAVASAALVALAYVVFFSPSQDAFDDHPWLALRSWQSTKSTAPLPPQRRVPTLVVRNHSGLVNEPLELGVSVDAPDTGTTVTIKGMAPGARLTAGVPLSFTEWRVPAEQISSAMVIPPADFVGELNLSAELRNPEGAAQVTSFMQLVWKVAAPAAALVTSNAVPATAAVPAPQPSPPQPLPQPQLQQQQPPQQPQQQMIAALPPAAAPQPPAAAPQTQPAAQPPAQPRADAPRELSPNEIASMIRRAQEMLANGDIKAARLLLLRAAEARDARAALALAKTYDPIALRQLSTADPGPDVAQARNWYQRAREWGAPEAQRQLDALASYSR
jgi:hypothetical protein